MSKLPSHKVFVGNLPDECDQDRLRQLFEEIGPVSELDVIKNYGFVHFENEDDAKKAVSELNESEFDGMTIKVEASHSKVRHKPGMGSMTECYRCGKDGHWSRDCPTAGGRGRGRGSRGGGGGGGGGAGAGAGAGPGFAQGRDIDPYDDPYFRGRYMPAAYDRYHPYYAYDRRPFPPYRDPYFPERDPYGRPGPPAADYYERLAARDAYYDYYARRRAYAEDLASMSYPESRVYAEDLASMSYPTSRAYAEDLASMSYPTSRAYAEDLASMSYPTSRTYAEDLASMSYPTSRAYADDLASGSYPDSSYLPPRPGSPTRRSRVPSPY